MHTTSKPSPAYPLVTIGITAFNARETIDRAIRSAINQDWPNTQILVVDDHSSDGTGQYLKETWESTPGLTLIFHQSNQGVGAARNTILNHSNGDFIAFFDDDDESVPNRLTAQYQRILEFEERSASQFVASYTAREQLRADNRRRIESTLGSSPNTEPQGEEIVELILFGKPARGSRGSCATCSMMARREVFQALNGFDAQLRRGEDTDFNVRLGLAGGFIVGISDPLVKQHITKTADKNIEEAMKNAARMHEKYRDYLDKSVGYEFSLNWTHTKLLLRDGQLTEGLASLFGLLRSHPRAALQRIFWVIQGALLRF